MFGFEDPEYYQSEIKRLEDAKLELEAKLTETRKKKTESAARELVKMGASMVIEQPNPGCRNGQITITLDGMSSSVRELIEQWG
jgi:dipeptidase